MASSAMKRSTRLLSTTRSAQATAAAHQDAVHLPLTYWPKKPVVASTSSATTQSTSLTSSFVALPSHIFAAPSRPDILHQCVVAHLASLRQGTAANKNRAQVRGSGKKIMRQKGTGKARVGDRQSPIRRGGGRAFPKIPKDWSLGLNRKVFELGLRVALSERWRRGELTIIPETPSLPNISTRELLESISQQPLAETWKDSLFLLSEITDTFGLSARNLPKVSVKEVDDIDVYSLLQGKRVILDMKAVQQLEQRLNVKDAYKKVVKDISNLRLEGGAIRGYDFSASQGRPGDESNNPDGGIKKQDVVVEQEEAPVQEQRHDDPLAGQTSKEGDKGKQRSFDSIEGYMCLWLQAYTNRSPQVCEDEHYETIQNKDG